MDQLDAMVHSIMSSALGCPVVNMSMPGYGSEKFVSAYIHAYAKHKPKLFLAELVEDRSRRLFSIPNAVTEQIANRPARDIYDMAFQYSMSGSTYVTNDMDLYHVHNSAGNDPVEQQMMKDCIVQGYSLHQVLTWFNAVNVYYEERSLLTMRTVANIVALEELSGIVGVPVLYYRYNSDTDIEHKLIDQIGNRYMNTWHNLHVGTNEWAGQRLHGQHLADHTHLNKAADDLVIRELIVPFVVDYAKKHSIDIA